LVTVVFDDQLYLSTVNAALFVYVPKIEFCTGADLLAEESKWAREVNDHAYTYRVVCYAFTALLGGTGNEQGCTEGCQPESKSPPRFAFHGSLLR
jgi:hypothetical protein